MHDDLITVYRARTPADAHLLRNLLEEAGIRATVTNDKLSGGAGVELLGWSTEPLVQVIEADAGRARAMALDFDRRQRAAMPSDLPVPDAPPSDQSWPTCPACGRPRTTSCPVCHTSGHNFPPADIELEDASREAADEGEQIDLRLCTTCDEPFTPVYLPRCEWCGYVFGGAAAAETAEQSAVAIPDRDLNTRVVAVALIAVALLGGILMYFLFLFVG